MIIIIQSKLNNTPLRYKDDDIIITFCLEGKSEESIDSLFDLFYELLSEKLKYKEIKFSLRKDKNKLYIEFKREYKKEIFLENIILNINEFIEVSLMFRNNFKIDEFLDMSFDKFFISLLSLIFSIKIKGKNLQKLLLYIENYINKIREMDEKPKEFDENEIGILLVIINCINGLINSKIELNFTPNKILQFIQRNGQDKYSKGDMKILRKEIENLLKDLNQKKLKGILNHLKLEKFLITIFFAHNKSGFSLEINTNGLTSVVDKLVLSNES
jgi:hypothetical protein